MVHGINDTARDDDYQGAITICGHATYELEDPIAYAPTPADYDAAVTHARQHAASDFAADALAACGLLASSCRYDVLPEVPNE
jgi:hypothetical protein